MSALDSLKQALVDESTDTVVLNRSDALQLLNLCEITANTSFPRYRHYKGGEYVVVCEATFEGDKSPMVIYRAGNGSVWARFSSNFHESVIVNGLPQPRFSLATN